MMKKFNVLIVEDEAIIALHMKNLIQRLGNYTCTSVSSGEHAIEITRTFDPHVIFMDINLAGEMNGIEAAKHIHDEHDVPVVFVSAYTDDETFEEVKRSNPAGYLTKPVCARSIKDKLTSLLDNKNEMPVNFKITNSKINEFGGVLETPIMALPQFVLRPEE